MPSYAVYLEIERTDVVYQPRWTNTPEEPWTARKAMRRLLEHEREHLEHIRDLLRAPSC